MANPKIKLKRSSVENKIPTPDQLPLGEIALNTYDGYLYASKNVGIGTTVIAINPFRVGTGTDSYNAYFTQGNIGIGTTNPTVKLDVVGDANVTGIITATSFDGSGASLTSIPNGALDNSTVSYGGIQLSLGGSDATPAFDLADATNYPYASLTGITTDILGDTTPQLGGNLDLNSNDITGTGNMNVTGIITATSFGGSGSNLTGIVTGIQAGSNITILESPTGNFIVTSTASGGSSYWTTSALGKTYTGIGTTSAVGIGTIIELIPYDTQNDGTLRFEGSAGHLFSITNQLSSGSIFSVNDISGIPSIDVDAGGAIQLAPTTGDVGIGLTNPTSKFHVVGDVNFAGGLLKEGANITAGKLSDNTNIDVSSGMVHLFTTAETTTSTPNLRYDASNSLDSKMSVGESITVVLIVTAAAAGYSAQLTIDGSAVTESWLGGSAPSAGGSSGYDVYTYNIIKTASATFVTLANLTNFA